MKSDPLKSCIICQKPTTWRGQAELEGGQIPRPNPNGHLAVVRADVEAKEPHQPQLLWYDVEWAQPQLDLAIPNLLVVCQAPGALSSTQEHMFDTLTLPFLNKACLLAYWFCSSICGACLLVGGHTRNQHSTFPKATIMHSRALSLLRMKLRALIMLPDALNPIDFLN